MGTLSETVMKSQTFWCVALGSLLAGAAWAAEPAPRKPALPPGHPQIPAQNQPAPGNLPPGHPDISGPRQPALPPGHPSVDGSAKPKGPAATHGTLFVRAYQGTKGGPAIGAEPVAVELHHQGEVIQRLQGTLDRNGTVVFEKIPLAKKFQPVVQVLHAGVRYQAVGDVMDGYHAGQQIDLPLYEATETEPVWTVYMRHVIIEATAEGARVTEVVALENPGDRSWVGAARPDGKRQTVAFDVSAGADRFQFGAGGEESVKIENGKLINTLPLMPGVSQVQFSYVVPALADGKVRVKFVAPKAVKSMMVFVSGGGPELKADGLEASGVHDMGEHGKAQVFGGNNLIEGQPAVITLAPLPPPGDKQKVRSDAGTPDAAPTAVAKAVAGVGGGMGLAIGVAYVLLKPPASARPA
jgi:hypothetical protein